ncbi:MAG: type III restriction endonuclease subunit R [Sulfobacillus thermosulfidooxidans]|uniref:Type III restriction endonuclease subunit R n=1 Tax=Sulfobacillus thermosulfidooxidans TaxID=28034 RepID=A0A2T2WRP1_SULTH|nr:MAG: type III restriction endonuclease subunit R [Sulfobacillus thermosulfidooxidans]
MTGTTISRLIINSPYEEPHHHWRYDRTTRTFELVEGRRPAGYVMATPRSRAFDDPGIFVEIPLVNQIRLRVKAWRESGYPGVTSMTRRLLEYWHDPERDQRLFFAQLEAVETLIWLMESPVAERIGIEVPGDGGTFDRLCSKMATGTGKTVVMAMTIAWHILNKVAVPHDPRFSRNVLVVAPGLTVKNRLIVLQPSANGNYYEAFDLVPSALLDKLRQGRVLILNWHALAWESEESLSKRRSVDKRGLKSDEAYVREILGEMATARNILVINDEAHHAWRANGQSETNSPHQRVPKDDVEAATVWIGGLDRVHRARGILKCYDFSATPFTPSGRRANEEALFGWIVSDFSLNDAIESGLVKTPRVVVRDDALPDAGTYRSRLYHIYNHRDVKNDLNRRALPEEPLPDLVLNAYALLGYDWYETWKTWQAAGVTIPPVMITVCNRTETAARVKHAFDTQHIPIHKLCEPDGILHIDSKVLGQAEAQEEALWDNDEESGNDITFTTKLSKVARAEQLRRMVDTVGKAGQPGEKIQNVISVGMLSEGWDAKTVTHIMGLRAFTSQLLCEQVVGRGLRRMSYEVNPETGLFDPEYVNIVGVPFTFLPYEDAGGGVPIPPSPKTAVEPDPEKAQCEIVWPNIVRIDHAFYPTLTVNWSKVSTLELDAAQTAKIAELAPILEGKPDVTKIARIQLERLAQELRTQRIIFEAARDVFEQMKDGWRGGREILLAQLVRIVEQFIQSDRLTIVPLLFYHDPLRRQLVIALNMSRIVQHVWDIVRQENSERLVPVFDHDHPIRSTAEMRTWYTGKPCERTQRSHINVCVYDSTWEETAAYALDTSEGVTAWVKNDHLGFEIFYIYRGVIRKYRPDFLVRLTNGQMMVLEIKGEETEQDRVKHRFLDEWVRAVNIHGAFGYWKMAIVKNPGEIHDLLGTVDVPKGC